MADLTVLSIPVYFGTMEAERRYLRARAAERGPSPADYTRDDTVTSLLMGVGSIVTPLVVPRLIGRFVPGTGKWGRAVVGAAVSAAVVTTVADRLANAASEEPRRRTVARVADRVRRVTGPAAVATGTFAAATWFRDRTKATTQWKKSGRDLGSGPVAWITAIAAWDFIYYWNHRFMHEVRLLWAHHVIHHSSERYNLSTALRQPVSDLFAPLLPYGVLARFGVRPHLLAQARAINLLYQYWIHTEAIDRIGSGEEVLNTPSHHRVHHGSNRQYLDRNHGSILIVWDRLFGTFEREDDRVIYGLTTNIDTFNPVVVVAHEYRDMVRDVSRSTTWRERLSYVLRRPGWGKDRAAVSQPAPVPVA